MAKLRYTFWEFCQMVGISRDKAYQRIERGELTVVRDGNTLYVTHAESERYAKTPLPSPYTGGKAVAIGKASKAAS